MSAMTHHHRQDPGCRNRPRRGGDQTNTGPKSRGPVLGPARLRLIRLHVTLADGTEWTASAPTLQLGPHDTMLLLIKGFRSRFGARPNASLAYVGQQHETSPQSIMTVYRMKENLDA